MAFEEYWDNVYRKIVDKPVYDDWLDKYQEILNGCTTEILDLGCGTGNDTLYLIEKGFNVISCDYSEVALYKLKKNILNSKTLKIDISNSLPFQDNEFGIIIADLSLHYFDEKTTQKIMYEIKRVLTPNGVLFARVNSIHDLNYGSNIGKKLENKFYLVDGYNKRFFDIEDVNKYFSIIGNVSMQENEMVRYGKAKKLIEVIAQKDGKG